jgi:uncharacterized damage-inducible protein DinB
MERLEIIEALKDLPDNVAAEVAGVPDVILRQRPSEGEWSIKEVVGHLRDMAEVWHRRIYSTWSLTDPVFANFDGEASVKERNYQDADLAGVIEDMRRWRAKTIDVLKNAVDWTRLGQHPGMGRRTLKQFGEFMVNHEAEHLASIRTIKSGQATKQPG